jgi:DUF1365 family protein
MRHPMASLAALAAIHRNALRLWRARVPFHRRPDPPHDALQVGRGRTAQRDPRMDERTTDRWTEELG